MNLQGKRVLLTGAGSGIGRATAAALARRGARLVLFGRRAKPLQDVQRFLCDAGSESVVVAGDVTDPTARTRALAAAADQLGGLDVLINNAGNVRASRLERTAEDEIRAMIDVELLAPILLTREALALLRASGDAMIVNVASGIALIGAPFYATYAAAKAGLARFGEALRRELLDEGIHVMTIYPGATETPMMATNLAGPDLGFSRETPEAVAEALVTGIEERALEVIRGGEVRAAMIATNRDRPEAVDERFRGMKDRLEVAVSGHRAL